MLEFGVESPGLIGTLGAPPVTSFRLATLYRKR